MFSILHPPITYSLGDALAVMKGRVRHRACWSAVGLVCAAACSLSCQTESKPAPQGDGTVLDGMQLTAARRVGLESALDALQRGDLERLKMLRQWALGRAQVPLLSEGDLAALDLGMACLNGSVAPSERTSALERLPSGPLRDPARELCVPEDQ